MPAWKEKTEKQKHQAYEALKRWRAKHGSAFNAEATQSTHLRRSIAYRRAWPLIVEHYGNACLGCGSTQGICFDHVVPLSQGGENQLSNGQPICRRCNTFKGQIAERTKDWRPDKGAWIVALLKANPHLVIRKAGKRFRCLALAEQRELSAWQETVRKTKIVMPEEVITSG